MLTIGSTFAGEFLVESHLKSGGMGSVFVVRQLSTDRRRALKVMRREFFEEPSLRERFSLEARIAARLETPHTVDVIGAGVDAPTGIPWLCMELLSGEDLGARIKRGGPMAWAELRPHIKALAQVMARAASAGVVHRDLKPENLFLARASDSADVSVLKVLDFGIAKLLISGALTTAALGTPLWSSPEQLSRGHVSPGTDVWALGLIAFYLLTGTHYWKGIHPDGTGDLASLLYDITTRELDPPSLRPGGPRLPRGFDPWFRTCLARDANSRFADGGTALDALIALFETPPPGIVGFGPSPLAASFPIAIPSAPRPQDGAAGGHPPFESAPTVGPSLVGSMAATPRPDVPVVTPPPPASHTHVHATSASPPKASRLPWVATAIFLALALVGVGSAVAVRQSQQEGPPLAPSASSQARRAVDPAPVDSAPSALPSTVASSPGPAGPKPSAGPRPVGPNPTPPAPPARLGPTVAPVSSTVETGPLGKAAAANGLQRLLGPTKSCYEKELARNPAWQGPVQVTLNVRADGSVEGVTGRVSGAADLTFCIQQAASALSFGKSTAASKVILRMQLSAGTP